MLGKNKIAKIADFGLSRDIYEQGLYKMQAGVRKFISTFMPEESVNTLPKVSLGYTAEMRKLQQVCYHQADIRMRSHCLLRLDDNKSVTSC